MHNRKVITSLDPGKIMTDEVFQEGMVICEQLEKEKIDKALNDFFGVSKPVTYQIEADYTNDTITIDVIKHGERTIKKINNIRALLTDKNIDFIYRDANNIKTHTYLLDIVTTHEYWMSIRIIDRITSNDNKIIDSILIATLTCMEGSITTPYIYRKIIE